MKGLDDADIVVTPPQDLLDSTMSPADFAQLFGSTLRADLDHSWPFVSYCAQPSSWASPMRSPSGPRM
ncbi:hypothetical protein CN208_13510 [Sinorhizobium meliloti]|nr:hypothetical protein CN208_13510 [Sinorhizobium meliloti]